MKGLLLAFCAVAALASRAEDRRDRVIRRLQAVNVANVKAAWADMAARWPDRFAKDPSWLAGLEARRDGLLNAIMGDWGANYGELPPVEMGEAFLADLRGKLLQNPLLDAGRILAIRRRPDALGLYANWNQPRDAAGCTNELGVLANLRGTPSFRVLDATPAHGYLGEVCLHWDARRAMYTRRTERMDHPPKVNAHSRADEPVHRVFELDLTRTGARPRELELIPDADVNCYAGCYLPDGALIFLSDASMVGVPCVRGSSWVASLYRREANGAIRRLTFDQDNNWCPNVMPDGRVMFLHWEYAGIVHYASRILFTMNPDGTTQRACYGSNSYWPNALFDARTCPDNPDRFTATVSGHHGQSRMGELVLFDVNRGRKHADGVVQRFPERGKKVVPIVRDRLTDYSWPKFCHPWPLSQNYVLVTARPTEKDGWGLYLADAFDNLTPIVEDAAHVYFEARPLQPSPVPPVIADRTVPGEKTARMKITDIYEGPGLAGVPRGTVKALRLFTYSFAYRWMGGETDHHGLDGPWDINRILGTVPVEPDGSAYFVVPANLPISIQPLDEKGRALQLMRSWTQAMPGTLASCSGCHEENQASAGPNRRLMAMERPPSEIRPWYGPERGFSFRREVQPVLDRYCVSCHDGKGQPPPATPFRGGLAKPVLTDRPDVCIKSKDVYYLTDGLFPPSYLELCSYVRNHTQEGDNDVLSPCDVAADTTLLVQMLERGHHGVQLDAESWDRINTWIDLNRMGHGTWSETVGTNRVAHYARRRADLQRRYANLEEDHEKTFGKAVLQSPALPRLPVPARAAPPPAAPVAHETRLRTLDLGAGVSIVLAKIPPAPGGRSYWMGVDEITNEQYRRLVPAHDSKLERGEFMQFTAQERGYPLNGPRQPVVRVSRDEAAAFCACLGRRLGLQVRLPSGAEWEWAARAGSTNELWFGSRETDFSKVANLADKTFRRQDRFRANVPGMAVPEWRPADVRYDDGYRVTAPVSAFAPNPWGLRNVHGNVWEWTADTGREGRAVARGGSCWSRPKEATFDVSVTYRSWQKVHDVGFRILVEDR
ncbi:MAG: SUMF1/EgtB/PvdO family nonheme iron enzyme [Kiritimatiellia bacterium]